MHFAKIPTRGALWAVPNYKVRVTLVTVNHKHHSTEVTSNSITSNIQDSTPSQSSPHTHKGST
jgi:hypothetical protein